MKLLYFSSFHDTLEYDDLSLFTELGIEWFSTGLYMDPKNRPGNFISDKKIDITINNDLTKIFLAANPTYKRYGPVYLTNELVNYFDVILVSLCAPYPYYIGDNWPILKNKNVIWRTYCQQDSKIELYTKQFKCDNFKIIRNSPRERTIPNYAGDDAIIRTYVDENIYNNWNGNELSVLTFNNFFALRETVSNTNIYLRIKNRLNKNIPFKLYGMFNENCNECLGTLSWEEQKKEYRNNRVYFALGSKPATATFNLVEALMTGIPIVTWNKKLGSSNEHDFLETYEVPDFIKNKFNGICSDDEFEIENEIKNIINDFDYAKALSIEGRKTAIELFGKEKIKQQWKDFFKDQFNLTC